MQFLVFKNGKKSRGYFKLNQNCSFILLKDNIQQKETIFPTILTSMTILQLTNNPLTNMTIFETISLTSMNICNKNMSLTSILFGTMIETLWNSTTYYSTKSQNLNFANSLKYITESFLSNLYMSLYVNQHVTTWWCPCVIKPCCHHSYAIPSKWRMENLIASSFVIGLSERCVHFF